MAQDFSRARLNPEVRFPGIPAASELMSAFHPLQTLGAVPWRGRREHNHSGLFGIAARAAKPALNLAQRDVPNFPSNLVAFHGQGMTTGKAFDLQSALEADEIRGIANVLR
jgi:hypothetical protein